MRINGIRDRLGGSSGCDGVVRLSSDSHTLSWRAKFLLRRFDNTRRSIRLGERRGRRNGPRRFQWGRGNISRNACRRCDRRRGIRLLETERQVRKTKTRSSPKNPTETRQYYDQCSCCIVDKRRCCEHSSVPSLAPQLVTSVVRTFTEI